MFADASALTAILANAPDAGELLARMQTYRVRVTSPLAVWETVVSVGRVLELEVDAAQAAVQDFLTLAGIAVEPVPVQANGAAIDAFARFGKGRHPAALNFGDCFAYACAKQAGLPLLYKGGHFPQTDIETA